MKMRLLSEATFKFQQLKIWKCCFRARRPLNSKSWRCENKAFVWGFLQIPKVEDVKTKLSYEASFKFQQLKMRTHVFNAALPLDKVSPHMQNTIAQHHQWKKRKSHLEHPGTISSTAHTVRNRFDFKAAVPATVVQASLLFSSPDTLFTQKKTMFLTCKSWQTNRIQSSIELSFRARHPSNVEEKKTKLSW